MYRRLRGRITPAHVIDFLMLDREFPGRSDTPDQSGGIVAGDLGAPDGTFLNRAEKLLGRLRAEFDFTHATDIITQVCMAFLSTSSRSA